MRYGECAHCGLKDNLVTNDGRCAPCRYKDSHVTKKHEFVPAIRRKVPRVTAETQAPIPATLEEVNESINKAYSKDKPDQNILNELFNLKRRLQAFKNKDRFTYNNYHGK